MARYGVWAPIPMWVGGTRKWASGTNNRRRTAVIIHRMEGTLMGSDSYLRREYADYYPYSRLNASTHFGVGNWNGNIQVRQWVDTANTAFGWAARPTDTPSAVAQRTLTNLWSGYEDLNWQTIHVEVEGFYYQAWNSRWTPALKGLLKWLYQTHGNLTVMVHTDCSSKPCPGLSKFMAGMPGYYGAKLANIFGTVTPSPTPVPSDVRVGGLPVNYTSRYGWKGTIKAYKPRRNGASISSSNFGNTDSNGEPFFVWGEVAGQDMTPYGLPGGRRWFFGPQYINGGWRTVYVPYADLTARNF